MRDFFRKIRQPKRITKLVILYLNNQTFFYENVFVESKKSCSYTVLIFGLKRWETQVRSANLCHFQVPIHSSPHNSQSQVERDFKFKASDSWFCNYWWKCTPYWPKLRLFLGLFGDVGIVKIWEMEPLIQVSF
jgi:hypothetical protein